MLDSAYPEVPPRLPISALRGKRGGLIRSSDRDPKVGMEKTLSSVCTGANGRRPAPSFLERIAGAGTVRAGKILLHLCLSFAPMSILLGGCGTEAPKPAAQAEEKPAEPAVPDEIQSAADSLLGKETQVLLFGDLAKNGKQEFLAANVVPKTPTNNLPGTIITRAVVVENSDGKWSEVLRCDEHLKNQKGSRLDAPDIRNRLAAAIRTKRRQGFVALLHAAEGCHRFARAAHWCALESSDKALPVA